jgi:hypothetical protein
VLTHAIHERRHYSCAWYPCAQPSILTHSCGVCVCPAALRTAYELAAKQPLPNLVFEGVRGLDGVKRATVSRQRDVSL